MQLLNEHFFRIGWLASIAATMLLAAPLTACGASSNQETDSNAATQSTAHSAASAPTIHGRQTLVLLTDGHPRVAHTYHRQLGLCRNMPTPPTALDKAVEAKLGRIHYEFWIDGNRAAAVANIWSYRQGEGRDVCNFYPVHNIRRVVSGPDGTYRIDVDESTAVYFPESSYHRSAPRPDGSTPPTLADKPSQQKQRQKVAETLQKHGFGKIAQAVQTKPGHTKTSIAGQPAICTTGKLTKRRECVWSGGRQWGFYGHALDAYLTGKSVFLQDPDQLMVPAAAIMLSRRPIDGNGMRMTTQTFNIGEPVPEQMFTVPDDLSVRVWDHKP